jgi:tetratricopeptide (TPR) repeat protein
MRCGRVVDGAMGDHAHMSSLPAPADAKIGGRYEVIRQLGRGGMATIFHVRDLVSARELALKQLELHADDKTQREEEVAFEREFHVLAQLSHPSVVSAFDYGLAEGGPYYTMELLDGGDVRERAPMPWQEVCTLAHDVCSALALVHSRRLVHRDISPRNIRCTSDGKAKLIDFGAAVPMGPVSGLIVGTPQVVAPEVLQRANLDARTDLFSLGATLYFALTRRIPFAAQRFDDLFSAWAIKPRAPSEHVPGIPATLDTLVLSLLSIDPGLRPRAAFEVMERLAVVLGTERSEPISVSRAYLSAPTLVGREEVVAALQSEMTSAFGGEVRAVLLQGALGLGRTRMLDACGLAAKTLGARVLRVNARTGKASPFRVVEALLAQFREAAVETTTSVPATDLQQAEGAGEQQVQGAAGAPAGPAGGAAQPGSNDQRFLGYVRDLRRASRARPVVFAIDDLDRADAASIAVLTALTTQGRNTPLCIVGTSESARAGQDDPALEELARRSRVLALSALSRAQTEELLESMFGDVPNIGIVSEGVHEIARGNPRAAVDLAQHLVDHRLVLYERGVWTLPASLDRAALPKSAEDAVLRRIAALTPAARWLAEAQALASHRAFTHEEYRKLRPDLSAAEINAALMALVSEQVLVGDDRVLVLAHRGFNEALASSLSDEARAERHRALIALYEGRVTLAAVRHAFLAGLEEQALAQLAPTLQDLPEALDLDAVADLGAAEIAATFESALTIAERGGRSPRELNELRRWLASFAVRSDDAYYFRVADAWRAQLQRDAGYEDWLALAQVEDPKARLGKAMQLAFERYHTRPEHERVYRPDEAIRTLAHFAGISTAVASSRVEMSITESIPALLEPFAPTSPLIASIWQTAIGTREVACRSRPERARAHWLPVYAQLEHVPPELRAFSDVFRRAVAFGLGSAEASIGMPSAAEWANALDGDPVQRINALYLRRIVRLLQGDWEGAERLRKRAELARIGARGRQMFANLTWVELAACALARDLGALRGCRDRIAALARRAPGWVPHAYLAEGYLKFTCDDLPAAAAAFEAAIERVAPNLERPYPLHAAWCLAVAALTETLVGLEQYERARELGQSALATCKALEIGVSGFGISRALALAEAKLGRFDQAVERLEDVIQRQRELGVSGLHLGVTYEARTRVAIWADDTQAAKEYAERVAHEYRHDEGSPLGARYERLMNEARRMGHHSIQPLGKRPGDELSSAHTQIESSELDGITQTLREGSDGSTVQRDSRSG